MIVNIPVKIDIRESNMKLVKGDITDIEVDAFVFYARDDLELGSGFGTAIKIRKLSFVP